MARPREAPGGVPVARTFQVIHRHQPVEALGFLHVGGGDQHAHAFAARADTADQLRTGLRDSGSTPVVGCEDQQVGIVDQRAAQPELLFHAAGQLARRTLGERRQSGAFAADRLPARARPCRGRTADRRSRRSRTPRASGRGSCPAPGACRRCAGRPPGGGGGRACRHRAMRISPSCIFRAPANSASRLDLPTPSGPIRPTMRLAGSPG